MSWAVVFLRPPSEARPIIRFDSSILRIQCYLSRCVLVQWSEKHMGSMAAAFLLMLVVHSPFSMASKGSFANKAECQAAATKQPAPASGSEYLCVSEADLEQLQRASR